MAVELCGPQLQVSDPSFFCSSRQAGLLSWERLPLRVSCCCLTCTPGLELHAFIYPTALTLPAGEPRGSDWARNSVGALLQKNYWSCPP